MKHCRSKTLRIAIAFVVIAQMFAAFPVRAASGTPKNSSDVYFSHAGGANNAAAIGLENQPSALIATPPPILYTVTLQPDSAAGVDTYIYSGSKNSNYGNATELGIGEDNTSNNKITRSLIKFDLSSIPANATITAATLSLWTSRDLSSNTRIIRVYRLKTAFQETQATWYGPAAGVIWQTAGASGTNDRESTAIGTASILNNEVLSQEKQIVLQPARIQEIVSGTFVNRGFILVADTEQNDRFNYRTSDSTSTSQRPKLVVQFVVPPVVPSESPTQTAVPLPTGTATPSPTATLTFSPTVDPTFTPSATFEPSDTPTATASPTYTPSATIQPEDTSTAVPTHTPEPTETALPTATSTFVSMETATPTPIVIMMGPLAVSTVNPRYFAKPDGTIVYLTGSHTWCNLMDCGATNPIDTTFDYSAFLDFLVARNHNFFRLWRAENAKGGEAGPNFWFNPMPYQRSTTCCAFDGGNKFDLTKFNQAYFDRMRQRVIDARNKGIYVSIMLFDGWSVESKMGNHNPWAGHPYKLSNNINNINGDLNNDNQGGETHTLSNSQITALQEAYVRKVIDTVNDLDNVLYEISNESTGNSEAWQYHMINYIKSYEAAMPKQHPVGMTVEYPGGDNQDLYNSSADWISLAGNGVNIDTYTPPPASGSKVILADTDHLCGICGNRKWVWKSFTRGENPIFMDVYDPATTSRGMYLTPTGNEVDIRNNLGYTRSYASRIDLAAMTPQPSLCSTGFCLAKATSSGAEFLAYLPDGGSILINLSTVSVELDVEWFNPSNGLTFDGGSVDGGASRAFTAPFVGDAVLYLKPDIEGTPTPISTPDCTATRTPNATFTASATSTSTFTPTPTATATPVVISTFTSVPPLPTDTSTATISPTATLSSTSTPTGSFPMNPVLDSFNRANGGIGGEWYGYTSAFSLASNQLHAKTSGWDNHIYWGNTTFGANQEAYVRITQLNSDSWELSLMLKSQNRTSYTSGAIEVFYSASNNTLEVWTYDPTNNWVQYGADITSLTLMAGDQLGANSLADGTLQIYKNGSLLATRNLSTWSYVDDPGYIGLWFANASGQMLDDFGGGTR